MAGSDSRDGGGWWPPGSEWWEAAHPGWHWRNTIGWRGLTQTEVALALNISQKHVSQIVNQRKVPSADLSVRFAHFVGLDPWILWLTVARWAYEEALREERGRD